MDSLPPPVAAVLAVPAYVGGAILSLTLTRVGFQLLTKVAALQPPLPLYATLVRPHLRTLVGVVEGSLGPAAKFVPSATHVLLVALLLAVLVAAGGGGGEGKSAAKAPSRRR